MLVSVFWKWTQNYPNPILYNPPFFLPFLEEKYIQGNNKAGVVINADFQLECIYKHHGNIPPVVSMKMCTKGFNEEKRSALNLTASFHRLVYKDEYNEKPDESHHHPCLSASWLWI